MKPISLCIAEELGVREQQVAAAISLLDGGATVPFVARYRKEATGALDDAQLRVLEERLRYLRELDERRIAILDSISQQGKLGRTGSPPLKPCQIMRRSRSATIGLRSLLRVLPHALPRRTAACPMAAAISARPICPDLNVELPS